MKFPPLDKKERAAFRELLIPADGGKICSAAVLFLLSALAIPFSHIEAVAGLYLLYAAVFYYALTRSLSSVIVIGLPGAFLFGMARLIPSLPHPYLLPAVYAALILGSVGGAFLAVNCRARKYLPLVLLPVAAYLLPALLLDPWRALLVLFPVGVALVLSHALLTCTAQTPTLLRVAGVLVLFGIGAFLIWFYRIGWPQANPLVAFVGILRRTVTTFYLTAEAQVAAQGLTLGLSEVGVSNIAALIGNILPGLLFAVCAIFAFGIFHTFLRLLVCYGTLRRIPVRLRALTVSVFAAVLFLVVCLSTLVAGEGIFGTVCENLCLVLEPALFLVGILPLVAREGGRHSKLSLILLIVLLCLLWNYPSYAITVTAVIGAVRVLRAAIFTRKAKKKQ